MDHPAQRFPRGHKTIVSPSVNILHAYSYGKLYLRHTNMLIRIITCITRLASRCSCTEQTKMVVYPEKTTVRFAELSPRRAGSSTSYRTSVAIGFDLTPAKPGELAYLDAVCIRVADVAGNDHRATGGAALKGSVQRVANGHGVCRLGRIQIEGGGQIRFHRLQQVGEGLLLLGGQAA